MLERIPNDFSPAKKAALKGINYLKSAKVAFEAPRFWEDEGVYGGLAWTDKLNENVIYPSNNFHVAARRASSAPMSPAGPTTDTPERVREAADRRADPDQRRTRSRRYTPASRRCSRRPIAVNWGQVPYSEGVGALWDGGPDGDRTATGAYLELLKPEGPDRLRRRAFVLCRPVAGRLGASAHEALKLVQAMAAEKPARSGLGDARQPGRQRMAQSAPVR